MYRSNYLVKTQSGIYKSKDAIYRSDDTASDPVDQLHIHKHYNYPLFVANSTKINFALGTNTRLTLRLKYE